MATPTQLETKEAEALQTARERGYTLNPWVLHGKELIRLNSALCDALTWAQYHKVFFLWRTDNYRSYRQAFENALKVSRSAKVHAIASEGLRLVERCEQISKGAK